MRASANFTLIVFIKKTRRLTMARFIDSPELFGRGVGISTCGDFTCAICGMKHNQGNDKTEDYDGESIPVTTFAGVEVCGDCFEKIENEILRRMPDILQWYKKILERRAELKNVVNGLINMEAT
jgi:hypothetical protein